MDNIIEIKKKAFNLDKYKQIMVSLQLLEEKVLSDNITVFDWELYETIVQLQLDIFNKTGVTGETTA